MKIPQPCLVCSIWLFGVLALGMVFVLALSKIALGVLTGGIEGFFALVQHLALSAIGLLAGLSAWTAIPLGLALLFALFWMVGRYADRRLWRGLENVREEFVPLQRLLRRRGLKVYETRLLDVRDKLFLERDRIEGVQGLLAEELPRIESRLADLEGQMARASGEGERGEFRELMHDLRENSARLRQRGGDLDRFEKAKIRVATRLNLLRQRLTEPPPEGGDGRDALDGIESISLMEDLFPAGPEPRKRPEGE